ncbi:MAG: hypothetical protein HY319_09030 [Armatimonadetes bacterium]|nr:hypothetical protein [Armatimonadota bacterium]
MISPAHSSPAAPPKTSAGKGSSKKPKNKNVQGGKAVSKKQKPAHRIVEEDEKTGRSYKRGAFRRYKKCMGMRMSGKKHRQIAERLRREREEGRPEEEFWDEEDDEFEDDEWEDDEDFEDDEDLDAEFDLEDSLEHPDLPLYGPNTVVYGAFRAEPAEAPDRFEGLSQPEDSLASGPAAETAPAKFTLSPEVTGISEEFLLCPGLSSGFAGGYGFSFSLPPGA